MYNNGKQLPVIELRSALGAVLYTLNFNYKYFVTDIQLDQQPIYGATVEMADGTLAKHVRGYRTAFSIAFTDKYLVDVDSSDSTLGKDTLGTFCNHLRGWDDSGGTIRLYPYRDNTDLYSDCIIPDGGFTWRPVNDGTPDTKATEYNLTLTGKNLTTTKWS
jgi:hypothetical protein